MHTGFPKLLYPWQNRMSLSTAPPSPRVEGYEHQRYPTYANGTLSRSLLYQRWEIRLLAASVSKRLGRRGAPKITAFRLPAGAYKYGSNRGSYSRPKWNLLEGQCSSSGKITLIVVPSPNNEVCLGLNDRVPTLIEFCLNSS